MWEEVDGAAALNPGFKARVYAQLGGKNRSSGGGGSAGSYACNSAESNVAVSRTPQQVGEQLFLGGVEATAGPVCLLLERMVPENRRKDPFSGGIEYLTSNSRPARRSRQAKAAATARQGLRPTAAARCRQRRPTALAVAAEAAVRPSARAAAAAAANPAPTRREALPLATSARPPRPRRALAARRPARLRPCRRPPPKVARLCWRCGTWSRGLRSFAPRT
jgi:hypothetical protein